MKPNFLKDLRLASVTILIAAGLFSLTTVAQAAEYYAAPTGSPTGNGSINSPWDLATALTKTSVVHGGDTLWLRGGTYKGTFTSNLSGTSSAPVIIRQYSGERATIDGSPSGNPPLAVYGAYGWYWGFEVMNSDPQRVSSQTGSAPSDLKRGIGIWVEGRGTKFINMVVHDTAEAFGFWTPATDAEIYGTVIYANGWDAPDRGHGHGIYVQNQAGTKHINDNIIFNQFGYGIHGYTEGGNIDNIDVEGNILFNNGLPSLASGNTRNILIGGGQIAHSPTVSTNFTYFNPGPGENNVGYGVGCQNLTATGNYFANGASALTLGPCPGSVVSSNTFYGATSGLAAFPSNIFMTSRPTSARIVVRPNKYESGRANIVIFNWPLQGAVAIDPSGVLAVGDSYKILDAQNVFGPPVLTGTFFGGTISMTTNQTAVAAGIGMATPPHTNAEFGAYILMRTGAGGTSSNQAPVVNAGSAQNITLPASSTVTGTATDDGLPSHTLTTTWKMSSGPGTVTFGNANLLSTTAFFSVSGTYVLTLSATDGALTSSSNVTITVNPAVTGGSTGTPIRINAGGSAFTDSKGNVWSADMDFSGGYTYATGSAIKGTDAQPLYQRVRYGTFQYVIPAANGPATVNLKFAEPYFTTAGQRIFNVSINGQTVLTNFDIVAAAGAFTVIDKQFPTSVTSGKITIQFTPTVNNALINAIEILPAAPGVAVAVAPSSVTLTAGQTQQFTATVTNSSNTAVTWSIAAGGAGTITASGLYTAPPTVAASETVTIVATSAASASATGSAGVSLAAAPSFTALHVNAGGLALTTPDGTVWSADTGYSGAYTYSNPAPIAGTTTPAIYQSLRYGAFSYQLSVPNGLRTVRLRFAEIFYNQAGRRVFNVSINGQQVLTNFDIVAVGGAFTAVDRQFQVNVTNGQLKIDFTPVVENPQVNAIEVIQ